MGVNQNAKKGIEYYQSLLPANAKNNSNNSTKKDLSYYQSLLSKANTVETAPTSAVSLQSSVTNKSEKPTNPSDLLKRVTVVDNRKLSTALRANELENQIKQKESEYVKAANMSDWSQSIKERERISKELSAMQDELKSKRAELRDPSQDKLLTAQQVKENQKNAPLMQKIDKAIKNDIPKTVEKVGRTAADLVGSGLVGATNAVEGMADFAVGNVGALASGVTSGFGLAPNSLSEKIKKGAESFTKFNFSGEDILEEKKNEGTGIYEPKILGMKVRDAVNTISNMITSAAVGGVPGFMASAAGQGIEEALLDNQSLNRAVVYGDISGAIEGLTEKMFDAVKLLGGGKFDKFLPKGAIGKFIGGSVGEGIEEVIADGINPFLKYLTYEKGTYDMPTLAEYLNMLKQSAWNGFVIGLIMKGGQDVTSPQIREQYKQEVYTAVDKSKLPDNVKGIVKEAMITPAQQQINQDLQNYKNTSDYSKYISPNTPQNVNQVENVLRESPQTQNIQQPNVTLPTQAEMAQKANVNQIRGNTKLITQRADNKPTDSFQKGLEKFNSKNYTQTDDMVVLDETPQYLYNLGFDADKPLVINMSKLETIMKEPKGAFNNKNQHGITMDVVEQLPKALQNPLNVIKNPKYNKRVVVVTELTDQYGDIIIVPIEMNTDGYIENIVNDVNRINTFYGKENYDIPKVGNDKAYIEYNKDKIVYDVDKDITKKRDTDSDYRLQLPSTAINISNNIIPNNDTNINTQYAQNISNDTADTQSAFSMPENYISPVEDIQRATDFVKNATEKDVAALQKMIEEANKHSDRIDLQFFAKEARKKIEYLTKSQRYQRSKINALVDNLVKTYGLNKNETKDALVEYAQEYNSSANTENAKRELLKKLSADGILNGQPETEISNLLDDFDNDLNTVKRYEADRTQKKQENVEYQLDYKTVSKLYELKKQYQKASDEVMQNTLLTKADSVQLDRLLKGEITFDELPKNANRKEIEKAYEVRKPLADVNKEIQNYNKVVKQRRNQKMRELTSNSSNWKDKKSGLAYARETQERNIADIAPREEAKRITEELFEPVHRNEAQATRYKNEVRGKINRLKIGLKPKYEVTYTDDQGTKTEKVSESGLVQLYGEGKINDNILNKLGVDVGKIKNAVATFREIYNDLYHKTNEVLVKNGYAPVEFRKDYFPHFEETKPDTLIGKVLTKLGFKMDTRELPTDIAGLTHTFRPGKKWVSNFLQRTADVATYDAVKGFDNYLDGVADVIYHTEDIQNLRAFESALRYQHSEEVIKEQIDEIMELDVANEMKQSMIDQVYAAAENSLAHYVTDLRAYTDNLAGKKSLEDRTMEHNLGRGIYNITKNVQSRVSANMVGANISSALTNFIPLTQASAVIDAPHLLQATWDTVRGAIKSDGFAEQSNFLVNRRGSDKLYKTAVDKLAGATNLMSLFDNITSEIINRGRYYQNVSNGMNEADARVEADKTSANIMADRSKGSMPTVFNQSSPVTKLLTAFQLEVNNQYSYLLKDIPREFKDKVVGNLIWGFAKMFIGAWLYNELYERMTGRRAALDPINIVTETIGDVTEGKKASEIVSGLATEIVEDVPFIGGLIGGGRLPISSALPDVGEVAKAGISLFEDGDKKKAWQTLISEIAKPVFYILPPFGGGQLKKSVEGLYTYAKGGNYGINSKGEETLKYPVEQTPANLAKSALFGKWSTKEAVDYVDNGFKSLSVNQTESYKKAMEAGITSEQFYDAYNAQKGIESDKDKDGKTITNSKSLKKKQAIDEATKGLNANQKKILYDTFDVSKTVQEGKMLPTQEEQRAKLKK